jgi:hypothetical protein
MRAVSNKVIVEMILEARGSSVIQTLDGSSRPQTLLGKVIAIGCDVETIELGDLVISSPAIGEAWQDIDGKKFKSLEEKLAGLVFDKSELEYAKTIKRI